MNKRIKELAEQAGWMMGNEVEGFKINDIDQYIEFMKKNEGVE